MQVNTKSGSFAYAGVSEKLAAQARQNKKFGIEEEPQPRARYQPTADADQAYLDSLKPKARKAPRNADYLINKKPLGEADFETQELLRPAEAQIGRRYRRDSDSSSVFTAPGRHGKFEEEVGDESIEFTSSKLKRSKKSSIGYEGLTVPTIETAPSMQIRLNSHVVPVGMSTKFMCSFTAKPAAKITWTHNGDLITSSSKYEIENIAGVVTLKINNCNAQDAGTYKFNASNVAGECSDYGKLEVSDSTFQTGVNKRGVDKDAMRGSSLKMGEWAQREGYRQSTEVAPMKKTHIAGEPYFLSTPRDQTVAAGETVRFTANVDGRPTPRVAWSRGGVSLRENEKYSMRAIRNQHFCYFQCL